MSRPTILLTGLAASLFLSTAAAADKTVPADKADPARQAALIAPLLDAQTVAVAHVDLQRMSVEPLFDEIARMIGETPPELQAAKTGVTHVVGELTKLGVGDGYVVFSLPTIPQRTIVGALVLKPGMDVAAVQAAARSFSPVSKRVGDLLLLADREETLAVLQRMQPESRPELSHAFASVGDAAVQLAILPPKHFVKVVDQMLPELPKQLGGGSSSILTRGALWAAVGIDLSPKLGLRVVAQSQDAASAAALRQKLSDVAQLAAAMPEVKKTLPTLDRLAEKLLPKVENDQLVISLDDAAIRALEESVQPLLSQARAASQRAISINNLKQIALAMHNYHDVNKSLPPAAKSNKDGPLLLSWRVLILPFIGETPLYRQFHLDEPWDSPHNKTLIDRMPAIYRSPFSKLADKTRTNYVLPTGAQTAFAGPKAVTFKDVTDGTNTTIMTLEVDDSHAVVWTKPDDLPFDAADPLKGLGHLAGGGFIVGFMDGSARFIANTIPPEILKAMITPSGGEAVNFSKY